VANERPIPKNVKAYFSCPRQHPAPEEVFDAKHADRGLLHCEWDDMIRDLQLTVLGGFAAFERQLIRSRTGEGRARALARGQNMGRPIKSHHGLVGLFGQRLVRARQIDAEHGVALNKRDDS
jgi:hypothetical protein